MSVTNLSGYWMWGWSHTPIYEPKISQKSNNRIGKLDTPLGARSPEKKEYHCNYTVLKEDFFSANIEDIDSIYSYMMPHLMQRIWRKVEKECKPGTLLYSNSFPIAGVPVSQVIEFERDQNIYVYAVT